MVDVRQLELNLEVAFEEADEVPEKTDVLSLWAQFEGDLTGLEQRDHLRVAGDILMRLAGLCEKKAKFLWEDWEDAYSADEPVMGGDWLQGVTRQTQELDFSGLVQRSYRKGDRPFEEDCIIGAVEKAAVMEMVESLDDDHLKAQALAVSHSENVSDWVKAIASQQTDGPQRLIDVQAHLKMPMVEVWIAALLGGFELEQRGSFYQTQEVWISSCK